MSKIKAPVNRDRRAVLGAVASAPFATMPLLHAMEARAATTDDALRPRFHFQPVANWMNDPNGPIFWKGTYHLFYQYNPTGPFWAAPHWGHATSTDMISWRHQPVALSPTPGGADADGVFSGTAIVSEGRVWMMYTAVRAGSLEQATIKDAKPAPLIETQMIAVARDDSLRAWDKRSAPVISEPPAGMLVNGFRDPSPWREGDIWYAVLGSGIANRGGAILLYRSRDLIAWEYVKVFAARPAQPGGAFDPWEVWECPEFFALDDRHVLIFSCAGKAYWQSGRFDAESLSFVAERSGLLDYGNFYAPKSQLDADGNRILWGWLPETRPDAEVRRSGWAGVMSLPRVLRLDGDGTLQQRFLSGFDRLRRPLPIASGDHGEWRALLPDCAAEAEIGFERGSGDFTCEIGGTRGGDPWISVAYNASQPAHIQIDGRPVAIAEDKRPPHLHIFIDGSVIELSINDTILWTRRFAYAGERQDGVLRLRATHRPQTLDAWAVAPAGR